MVAGVGAPFFGLVWIGSFCLLGGSLLSVLGLFLGLVLRCPFGAHFGGWFFGLVLLFGCWSGAVLALGPFLGLCFVFRFAWNPLAFRFSRSLRRAECCFRSCDISVLGKK